MRKITYRYSDDVFVCDSCAPLKAAGESGSIEFSSLARSPYPGVRLPAGELKGLSSVGFWNVREPQKWGLSKHRNEGLEISWLENGQLDFGYKTDCDNETSIGVNSLVITRPWQQHHIGSPNISRSLLHWVILDFGVRTPNKQWQKPDWIILSKADFAELSERVNRSQQCVFSDDNSIRESFRDIATEIVKRENACSSRIAININRILISILDILRANKCTEDKYYSTNEYCVKIFLEQLKELYAENWSIPAMAEECGLKETRFSYYCKRLTNMTPLEYLLEVRLNKARELLALTPDAKMIDIAMNSGFSSSQYFSTAYKRKFGCSPSDDR